LAPDTAWLERVRTGLAPLPADRRAGLVAALGGSPSNAETDQIRVVVDLGLDGLVTTAVETGAPPSLALARVANEVAAQPEAAGGLEPFAFTALLSMESDGRLSATQSKAVLGGLLERGGGDPAAIAKEMGFEALGADALSSVVDKVIADNPEEWALFVGGDEGKAKKLQGFFTGEVMKATSGKANGKEVAAELRRRRAG
jgi:aspartyl-tRNA(Asn)/glutamyl-tRNA(Gln) amidotransferase subunit B